MGNYFLTHVVTISSSHYPGSASQVMSKVYRVVSGVVPQSDFQCFSVFLMSNILAYSGMFW